MADSYGSYGGTSQAQRVYFYNADRKGYMTVDRSKANDAGMLLVGFSTDKHPDGVFSLEPLGGAKYRILACSTNRYVFITSEKFGPDRGIRAHPVDQISGFPCVNVWDLITSPGTETAPMRMVTIDNDGWRVFPCRNANEGCQAHKKKIETRDTWTIVPV